MGLDDEEVDIAVGIGVAASVRAEEDHPRSRRGRGDAATGLGDQRLIDSQHGLIVIGVHVGLSPLTQIHDRSTLGAMAIKRI